MLKKMESRQSTPSVIAKLMGLDELQPQHVSHRPLKVLSEDYLRKTASIALLEKSSVHVNRLSRITAGKQHGIKHGFESEIPKTDKRKAQSIPDVKPTQSTERAQFSFARKKNAHAINFRSIDKQNYHAEELNDVLKDVWGTRTSGKTSAEWNVVRSIQKLENEYGESAAEYLDNFSRTHSELKGGASNVSTRIVVLKPNSRKAQNYARDLLLLGHDSLCRSSDEDYMELGDCLKAETKIAENGNKTRGMEPRRRKFRYARLVDQKAAAWEMINVGISHRILPRSRIMAEDSTLHLPEAMITPYQGSFYLRKKEQISNKFLNGSSFSREAKTKIFERWKTTKSFEEVEVSGGRCSLGQMFAIHDGEARPGSLHSTHKMNCSCGSICHQKDNSELCTSLVHSSKVSSTNDYIRNLPSPKLSKTSSFATDPKTRVEASQNWSLRQKEAGTDYKLSSSSIMCSGSRDILPLQLNGGLQDELEDMHEEANSLSTSDAWDNLTQQISSYDSPEGELIYRCTASLSGSVNNSREISQPSPDSVLEPGFKEENVHVSELSDSLVLDLSGLAMKLHLLNNESDEISSEGSVMAVSSDEDTEKGSVDCYRNYEKSWGPPRPEESRDFSYLIDVLDEATLFGLNLDMWCETWHEMEHPLSPSVFEALEKKYGKQTSWLKSERRLLFDCINSGLKVILDSYMDFVLAGKPLRRRFNPPLRNNDIEEELWMLLTQEKEAKKDTSEKAFGSELKWLELEDDISIICKEIAEFLFDELAQEMCSI